MSPKTLFEKIWRSHAILTDENSGETLLYVDRLLLTDSSSFHAFDLLEHEGRSVRRPKQIFGVPDHFSPSAHRALEKIDDPDRRDRIEDLERNCARWGIHHFGMNDPRMGITHVIGPEQGITLPGTIVLCGDSHTSTQGAVGALAFGIGGHSGHVMATQCLWQKPLKQLRVTVNGSRVPHVTAKDVILAIIARIGAGGAFGHVIEYDGTTIREMTIEERLTVCNMSIEAGGRSGLVAPDETTFEYLKGRPFAPKGKQWEAALRYWRTLPTDQGAQFDREITLDAASIEPMVSWGNTAEETAPITGRIPELDEIADADRRTAIRRSLDYMGLRPGMQLDGLPVDQVFIGSCTNGRIEDLRAAAAVLRGAKAVVPALVTPGSGLVRRQAEAEGLDRVFKDAGFTWGEAGCSMCVAMNGDAVAAGKRCASTSNRNFVGRQGPGSRTHLMSPPMAAAAAITGQLTDVRELAAISGGAA
jgi:3-isopropylmalate/(R)-2-methylmalate dehydratase large subunit